MMAWLPRRTLIIAAALVAIELLGVRILAALGLVESLLSPGGGRALVALPIAVIFFTARLLVRFVLPGVVASSLLLAWLRHRATGQTAPSPRAAPSRGGAPPPPDPGEQT
jgi:hypothetical protein